MNRAHGWSLLPPPSLLPAAPHLQCPEEDVRKPEPRADPLAPGPGQEQGTGHCCHLSQGTQHHPSPLLTVQLPRRGEGSGQHLLTKHSLTGLYIPEGAQGSLWGRVTCQVSCCTSSERQRFQGQRKSLSQPPSHQLRSHSTVPGRSFPSHGLS